MVERVNSVAGRRGVQAFLRDELLEALPVDYDRRALAGADSATYVIHQDVSYTYSKPVRGLRQRLVILPRRRHLDQVRVAHRFDVRTTERAHVRRRTDRFGNAVVNVDVDHIKERIEFVARAVVVRSPRASSSPDESPWLHPVPRTTRLTAPDEAIRDVAASLGVSTDVAEATDQIADFVRRSFEYRHDVTSVRTTAGEAWQLRQGVCQDMAHVMISICAGLGIAARYVSGHLVGDGASHAWVEVLDRGRGTTVAIDPTHNRRVDLRYLTTATGRDYLDVAPTTGFYTTTNGGRGRLSVVKKIRVAEIA